VACPALGVGSNVSWLQVLKRIPAAPLCWRCILLLLFPSGVLFTFTQIPAVSGFSSFLFVQRLIASAFNIRFTYVCRTAKRFGRVLWMNISAGRMSLGLAHRRSVWCRSMPSTDLTSILSWDALLGCILLTVIALASIRLLPNRLILGKHGAAASVSTAVAAYKSYEKASKSSARQMCTTFHVTRSGMLRSWRGWRGPSR
jgi:hypothetical protein